MKTKRRIKAKEKPIITCGAIISKKKKILLLKRNTAPFKNFWCCPGGHVEKGEKITKAIKREVKEESGFDFKPKFFKYYDEIFPKINWHALVLFFVGETKGKFKMNKKEFKDFGWFSEKEIEKLKTGFDHKKILKDYFNYVSKKRF